MAAYIVKRLLIAIPVILGLSVIVFLIMAMIPGDPALAILGAYATPENVERLNRDLGLDRSLVEQYFIWITNLLQGDFGRSYILNRPVLDEVMERFGATMILYLVEIESAQQFGAFVSNVANFDNGAARDLVLNAEVPLLHVGRAKLWVDGEQGRRGIDRKIVAGPARYSILRSVEFGQALGEPQV
jgi:ABC-type dipeptide/oligopeptide/nickel transport system permease component